MSCLQTQRKPSRWPQMLAALSYAEKLVECYDFETGDWVVMTEKPGHSFGSVMVALQVSCEKHCVAGVVTSGAGQAVHDRRGTDQGGGPVRPRD